MQGLTGPALANVQEALTLPYGLVRDGKVDRLWLERYIHQTDKVVQAALEPFGFYHATVMVALELQADGKYHLGINVEPGEPVRIANITVTAQGPGSEQPLLKKLLTDFPLRMGNVLVQQSYEAAKEAIKAQAQELGYLDAEFYVHEIHVDKTAGAARITLMLETGEQYFFADVHIEGAPQYPADFLWRHVTFKPGEIFSYAKLGETQRNFNNADRFKEVVITPQKKDAIAFKVPVLIQLQAAPRQSLRPGIGYGSDTGARFTTRYRDLNMLHKGHELFANLYLSQRLQGLATGYVVPSSSDVRSSTVIQLNLQKEEVSSYTSRLSALELDRNHSLGTGKLGTAYIKLQRESFVIGQQRSHSRLVLPGLRYIQDSFNSHTRPSQGYHYAFDLRGTHQSLGSDTALLQLITEGSYLFPLPWRLSFYTRAKAGITLLNDPLTDLPPSLRFFAGGDQSVRGYSYKSLGPRDASGQVVGGKHLLTSSVEMERALYQDWGVSIFYDIGNAFDTYTGTTMAQGAGIGVHYYTPVGALNFSLARQIGVVNPGYHLHFTVGFEF
ncbi:MAG: BamA/TamA family outer membrane protein [Gallionellaceae bacterium]|nr:BamA/TamA family outer membrane protein [Gallionellaceae bacterium]